jgi:hypothetical protein
VVDASCLSREMASRLSFGLDSSDQRGVELGKAQALALQPALTATEDPAQYVNSSTEALVRWIRSTRRTSNERTRPRQPAMSGLSWLSRVNADMRRYPLRSSSDVPPHVP